MSELGAEKIGALGGARGSPGAPAKGAGTAGARGGTPSGTRRRRAGAGTEKLTGVRASWWPGRIVG